MSDGSMIFSIDTKDGKINSSSVLEGLSSAAVFDVSLSEDKKTVVFTEGCDGWFHASLSVTDLIFLIKELQELKDKMK